MSTERVLFIDDETNILDAFKRQLRNKFEFDCAVGPEAALTQVATRKDYAVIVSDMRMPGMDGLTVLKALREEMPNAVHVMLTGNADQETAVRAINEGSIFRFISKPCDSTLLESTLKQALHQYRLITAEKELLQKTLGGSVKLLTDILSTLDPTSMIRTSKTRDLFHKVQGSLKLPNAWEIELAIMLSELGMVLLPAELSSRAETGGHLSEVERNIVKKVPETARNMIMNIPRLQGVAEIVYYQNKNFDGTGFPHDDVQGESIIYGARLLKILKAVTAMNVSGPARALHDLSLKPHMYDATIVAELLKAFPEHAASEGIARGSFDIKLRQLVVGQRLLKDLALSDGRLLLRSGTELTDATIQKIKNYSSLIGVQEPITVDMLIPSTQIEVR